VDAGVSVSNYSRAILDQAEGSDVVLFRNANCAPAEIVLTDVIDMSISRGAIDADAGAHNAPFVIATAPPGPLALPVGAALVAASVVIDLDATIHEEPEVSEADFVDEVKERLLQAGLRPHLWLKMLARLVSECTERIEAGSDRQIALGLVNACVVRPFLSTIGVSEST
jgi:hypothetical protein